MLLDLSVATSTILDIPSKSRMYARNISKTISVATGYTIDIPDKITTKKPRPYWSNEVFLEEIVQLLSSQFQRQIKLPQGKVQ